MTDTRIQWRFVGASELAASKNLTSAWDKLNQQCGDLPFLDSSAVSLALQVFGNGKEILAIGQSQGNPVAMLILKNTGRFRWQTFQPSQIPLGALVMDGRIGLDTLSQSLTRALPGYCLVLSLTQIDPRFIPRNSDTSTLRSDDYIDTAWIDVVGDFETYWNSRGKNLRQNMRKQRNKITADGIEISVTKLTQAGDMAQAIAYYGSLESAGWKAEGGTAIHPDNDQGRFYQGLLESAATRGEAAVFVCRFGDKIVAVDLCLERNDSIVILKTTYDESYHQISPAFLLRQDETEMLFSAGKVKRIEFYGRVMEWHTRWTENKRTLYHQTTYRHAWLKNLADKRRTTVSTEQDMAP